MAHLSVWASCSQLFPLFPPTSELEDYMSERVQFVITAQEWDPSFEEVSPGGTEIEVPPIFCIPSVL